MTKQETVHRLKLLRTVMTDLYAPSLATRVKRWLRIVPKAPQFNMSLWGAITTERDSAQAALKHSCGTAVCALGYAAIRPEFRALGLQMEFTKGGQVKEHGVMHDYYSGRPVFTGSGSYDFEAGAALFGLKTGESWRLFDPASYHYLTYDGEKFVRDVHPRDVVAHIDTLIGRYNA